MTVNIAIGPKTTYPSWSWVGEDTARELRKHFFVQIFHRDQLPRADVYIIVKRPLAAEKAQAIKRAGGRLIYLPIDFFESESHISQTSGFLRECDLVLVHSESLMPFLTPHAVIRSIDHHGKYFLDELSTFKPTGYVLWIGGFENIPFLIQYLNQHPLDAEIRILTNTDCWRAESRAREIAEQLGVSLKISAGFTSGLATYIWSAQLQEQMLREAKAAIDIKGDIFNQQHKPPTKAQKYICSGLPLAMNDSEAVSYFGRRGLSLPSPEDPRWFSREYYDKVCDIARRLKPVLTLQAIGERFRSFVEQVLR